MKKCHILLTIAIATALFGLSNCGGSKSLGTLSSKELFTGGLESYENKKYLKAIEHFQTAIYNYPGESNIDSAQYYLALSYLGNGDEALAAVEFNRLLLNYPSSDFFATAVYLKAVSHFEGTPKHPGLDQQDLIVSIKQFEDFIIDFPESEYIDDAKVHLDKAYNRMAEKNFNNAMVYFRINAVVAAKKYFQIVIDDYTNSSFSPLALFHIGEIEFKIRKYSEAKRHFSNFKTLFPENELVEKVDEFLEKIKEKDSLETKVAGADS